MENKRPVPWGCLTIWVLLLLVGGCTYNVATYEPSKPDYGPLPSCVETASTGCNWAGQKYQKGVTPADKIAQQRATKTGLYAED